MAVTTPVLVSTPVYEGPFDLLLQLILKEDVDIYEIDLARIVDAYLAELDRLQSLDLDVATEFLLIAATLVELKSRRLLPGLTDGDLDEEFALWEERDLLLARLIECKTFKDVAQVFAELAESADRSFARVVGPDERFADLSPDLLEGTSVRRLQSAAIRALTPRPEPVVDLFHVNPIRLTVAEAVGELADRAAPGPHDVPPAHRRSVGAARGDRALPGGARAVQAGVRRDRPARPVRRDRDHVGAQRRLFPRQHPRRHLRRLMVVGTLDGP